MIKRMSKLPYGIAALLVGSTIALGAFAGCGSDDEPKAPTQVGDGGEDGSTNVEDGSAPACAALDATCAADGDCCSGGCDPGTKKCGRLSGKCGGAGAACQSGPDCCTFSCVGNKCSDKQCVSDGAACTQNGECCGGVCENNACKALSAVCKTSGNACAGNGECCSKFCNGGICSGPSFCTQTGDVCASDAECCGGLCSKGANAALGLCAVATGGGSTGCTNAGEVCSGGAVYDGGALPPCGGECCSRSCLPHAASGIYVCQPPSGCRPTGELCKDDKDCCGSATLPDGDKSKVTCAKEGGAALGRCTNGNACTPAGGICRLQTTECNANANCCAGNVLQKNTCKQDSLGIPRCLIAEIDCTNPSAFSGKACASSADCCGLPCTPNPSGNPAFVCNGSATKCVDTGGSCTTSADCCSGLPCVLPPGSSSGTCGAATPPPDGGTLCAAVGQQCSASTPCCNGIPCENGVCTPPVVVK